MKGWDERLRDIGTALLGVPAVLWTAVLAAPLLPVANGWKVGVGYGLSAAADVTFWGSAAILGREVISCHQYLSLRNWEKSGQENDSDVKESRTQPVDALLSSPVRWGG